MRPSLSRIAGKSLRRSMARACADPIGAQVWRTWGEALRRRIGLLLKPRGGLVRWWRGIRAALPPGLRVREHHAATRASEQRSRAHAAGLVPLDHGTVAGGAAHAARVAGVGLAHGLGFYTAYRHWLPAHAVNNRDASRTRAPLWVPSLGYFSRRCHCCNSISGFWDLGRDHAAI